MKRRIEIWKLWREGRNEGGEEKKKEVRRDGEKSRRKEGGGRGKYYDHRHTTQGPSIVQWI